MQCVHFDGLKPVSYSVPPVSIPEPPTHEPSPPILEPPPPSFEPPPLGWSNELLEDSDDDQPYGNHIPVDENPAAVLLDDTLYDKDNFQIVMAPTFNIDRRE